MQFPPYAKALVAAIIAGTAPVAVTGQATGGVVSPMSAGLSIVSALVGFLVTYKTSNGKAPGGIVVTVKTDAEVFLAAILAGLPALVEKAATAALAPAPVLAPLAPVPAAITDYFPPTVAAPVVVPAPVNPVSGVYTPGIEPPKP